MYLDYVLLWPDNGCITAETCCLEVKYRVIIQLLILYVASLDGNKYHYVLQQNGMPRIKLLKGVIFIKLISTQGVNTQSVGKTA